MWVPQARSRRLRSVHDRWWHAQIWPTSSSCVDTCSLAMVRWLLIATRVHDHFLPGRRRRLPKTSTTMAPLQWFSHTSTLIVLRTSIQDESQWEWVHSPRCHLWSGRAAQANATQVHLPGRMPKPAGQRSDSPSTAKRMAGQADQRLARCFLFFAPESAVFLQSTTESSQLAIPHTTLSHEWPRD